MVKKSHIRVLVLALFLGVAVYFGSHYIEVDSLPAQVYRAESAALPETLSIPSLGIEAQVEHVGMTQSGDMATPSEAMNTAWYKFGTLPGNVGSAVIAGHLDTFLGTDAVFARLGELKKGDLVSVTDKSGKTHTFAVTGQKLYNFDESTEEVFGTSTISRLNLITCEGTWLPASKSYDKRLVVFTELVQ